MREQDRYWLAGLFEGEVTAYLSPSGTRCTQNARVAIAMTDRDVIERVQALVPGRVFEFSPKNPRHKTQWSWRLNRRRDVTSFLELILPILGSRRNAQAQRILIWATDVEQSTKTYRHSYRCPADAYTEANTYKPVGGYRKCRTCHQEQQAR